MKKTFFIKTPQNFTDLDEPLILPLLYMTVMFFGPNALCLFIYYVYATGLTWWCTEKRRISDYDFVHYKVHCDETVEVCHHYSSRCTFIELSHLPTEAL